MKIGLPLHITVRLWPSSNGERSTSVVDKARTSLLGFIVSIIDQAKAPPPAIAKPAVVMKRKSLFSSSMGEGLFFVFVFNSFIILN